MKQFLHAIDYLLWVPVIMAELALFIGAIRRHLSADFPRFVALLGFVSLRSVLLVLINFFLNYEAYFYTYYWGIGIETVLLILVAAETFRLLFEPISDLPANAISRMVVAVLTVGTLAVTAALWHPLRNLGLASSILYAGRSAVEWVLCFSFWLLVLYSRFMGLPWRSRMADIVSGFLFYLTIQAASHALVWFIPHDYQPVLSRVESISYLGGLCFWFAALRRQEPTFAPANRSQLLLLRAHMARLHAFMDRFDALEIQHMLSRALPPPGKRLRPQTFDELLQVLRAVEFPEYEPITYAQMLALRRGILYNCDWLLRFVRDQYQPLARDLEMLDMVETLQEDALRVIADCRKVFFGFSRRARLRRMQRLFSLYDEVRKAAMVLCMGAQPYLVDDIAVAL